MEASSRAPFMYAAVMHWQFQEKCICPTIVAFHYLSAGAWAET